MKSGNDRLARTRGREGRAECAQSPGSSAAETLSSGTVASRLRRIAQQTREQPQRVWSSLHHVIDMELLREAHRLTRKDGATGVDGQTAAEYGNDLEKNLESLLGRFKRGTYQAPPVRRVHIPKSDGRMRALGIPTYEDKILQRAVAMVLEAVYEPHFRDSSYGFRRGKSAHQAVSAIWNAAMAMNGGWVLDADIEKFFDSISHEHLERILDERVTDGVLRGALRRWLKAGVLEEGALAPTDEGTPQGGVISPLLANIFLHHVLDEWFATEVTVRLAGRAELVRYADDFVILFEYGDDARRVHAVLAKRLERFGLSLHPKKTRLQRFTRPGRHEGPKGPGSFGFLGFTFHWARARSGIWVVRHITAKDRFTRALARVREWCRAHMHDPVVDQHRALRAKLTGHFGYFGVRGNLDRLSQFLYEVRRAWFRSLSRRTGKKRLTWSRFAEILERLPLPRARLRAAVPR